MFKYCLIYEIQLEPDSPIYTILLICNSYLNASRYALFKE